MGGILTPGVMPAKATGFSIGAVPSPLTAVSAPAIGYGNGGDSFVNAPTDSGVRIHQLMKTVSDPFFWSREANRAEKHLRALSNQGRLSEADLLLLAHNNDYPVFREIAVNDGRISAMALIEIAKDTNFTTWPSGVARRAVQILRDRAQSGRLTQMDLILAAYARESEALMMIAAENPLTDRANLFTLAFMPGILGDGSFSAVAKTAARTLASLAEKGLLTADEILFARKEHTNPVVRKAAIAHGDKVLETEAGRIIADLTMKAWSEDGRARLVAAQDPRTPTPILIDLAAVRFEYENVRREALNTLRARSQAGGLSEEELAYIALNIAPWSDIQGIVVADDKTPAFALMNFAKGDFNLFATAAVKALRSRGERGLLTDVDLALASIHDKPMVRQIAAEFGTRSTDLLLMLSRGTNYQYRRASVALLKERAKAGLLTHEDWSYIANHPAEDVMELAAMEDADPLSALLENALDGDWKGLHAVSLLKRRSERGLISAEGLDRLAAHKKSTVRQIAAEDGRTSTDTLLALAAESSGGVVERSARFALKMRSKRGELAPDILVKMAHHPNWLIREIAAHDPKTPVQALIDIATGGGNAKYYGFSALRKRIESGKLGSEELAAVASHPKRGIRSLVAGRAA